MAASRSALLAAMCAAALSAQDGQKASRPGWPCVAGRAVDPAYLEISESTGGQLFLFQKDEVAQSAIVMSASFTHPATILRAVGHLSGTREFEFPVDSATRSILVMASLQCRNAIAVFRPNGAEMTAANSIKSVDLQAGRILQVDTPESGAWKLRLTGTGLFVVSVAAHSTIGISDVSAPQRGELKVRLGGEVSNPKFHLAGPEGDRIANLPPAEPDNAGVYRFPIAPPAERFRLIVTGTDASATPFQRIWPNLLHR